MTKPSKPEFTTYEGAVEFLAGGRNKDERPTKDGWNTRMKASDEGPQIHFKGAHIATFRKDGTISLPTRVYDWTANDRLNRYVFGPRGLAMYGTQVTRQLMMAHTGTLYRDVILNWDGKEPLIVTDHGIVGYPDRASDAEIESMVRTFAGRATFFLRAGFIPKFSGCQMCVRRQSDGFMWGTWLQDPEHVFGHISNSSVDTAFLFAMTEIHLTTVPAVPGKYVVPEEGIEAATEFMVNRINEEIRLAR